VKSKTVLKKEEIKDLIYDVDRYIEDTSPMCVYIPCRELLFKMMRACLGCSTIKDLWIYNNL
jgi:hypothetical protein